MQRKPRRRFWMEVALGALSAFALALTLAQPRWIEAVFHVEPDGGSGELEWLVTVVLVGITLTTAALARREWKRTPVAA